MSSLALLLVLAAAVAHAVWNVIAHGSSRAGLPFLWWGAVASTLVWVGAIPVTGGFGQASLGGFFAGASVSALLHVGYICLLQRGYATGDLSTVYAMARGTGPLISVLVAILVLGERPSPVALCGVAVILIGVLGIGALGRSPQAAKTSAAVRGWRARRMPPAVGYGLATGVAIAAYTVWDAYALIEWELSPVSFMVGCTALEIPVFTAAVWRRRRELGPTFRAQWHRIAAFGVISPLSYILVLSALTMAPVSLVAPLREVSVVLVSLFGAIVFRERHPVARVGAAVIVVGGVVILGLS